ncbi:26S proteasome non-ATPase regulatory subunit 5 [Anthophora retusa]
MEWFQEKIVRFSELNSLKEKKDILLEMQIKLGSLNNKEIEEIFRADFGQLFTLLNSNEREVLEKVCGILERLFSILKSEEVYQRYSTEISQLIDHPCSEVKKLALHEIKCIASNPEKIHLLLSDINLLVSIIHRIEDDDLGVAQSAMSIMCVIGKNLNGLQILYTGELLRSFAKLLAKNDIISFRVYEVVVDVAKSSKEGLEASVQTGFLSSLISILDNEDILLQVNALEILTELAITEDGLRYLEQRGVLKHLVQKIDEADENPWFSLFVPGLMKFFGNVACCWPHEIFSKYPTVVSTLFRVIEHPENDTILCIALDTLGHISKKVESKYALQALGDAMPRALRIIGNSMKGFTGLTTCCLNNLAQILDIQEAEQDDKIMSLTKSWFDCLGDDPLGMIAKLCEYTFADIRQPALEVLAVLASQTWGQEYISNHPGLIESLLYNNEPNMKCKEVIHEIIRRLTEAKPDILEPYKMKKLTDFVSQRSHVPDVAIEQL